MTTKVTFLCHGPDAIKITPVYASGAEDGSTVLQPGQFYDMKYVYQGLAFRVEEVART